MASPDRPTGEIAFLFTDIEGSTRLVQTLGTSGWRPVLERHREIVRAALASHAGHEVATEGDSFFVVFGGGDRPAGGGAGSADDRPGSRFGAAVLDAVLAAADAQRGLAAEPWPDGASIRVRMGIHAGTGELDADGSYVGHDVHRAARVASAAHGGQALVSETAAELVGHLLPAGVSIRPLGAHRLKDLRPERIAQLDIDGMPNEFPPIWSLDARPNNLPLELTSFVGRERELAETRELLERARLVTLTGPGGTGKTRLALQLAAAAADAFPDGAWFVPLATVRDPALVVPAILRAIGAGDDPTRRPIEVLAHELEGKRALLVLDNLEQVPAAAADIADLLARVPGVRIIAASRAPLRVAGEQEYPVPGLPAPVDLDRLGAWERERLPDALRRHDPASLEAFEAVRLFVTRGTAVRPGFAVTEANAEDVAAIVAHLGGVPLAIELAAARLRFLTPAAIHERLEGRLDLPGATTAAGVPERQRSLRAAIEWSHDLLEPPAGRLFERLAVFVGGFDLACAESVAGDATELGVDVLDGLASLVDHSLIRSGEVDGEPRFSLLGPIREYALERLEASGHRGLVQGRHARAYHALARELEPGLAGADQRAALDRLEREHANLRAALDWADEHAEAPLAVGIAVAIWRFWQKRGHLREARTRMATMLARPWFATADAPLRARAHEVMGGIVYWHGEVAGARPDYEAALAEWRAIGDRAEIANALYNLSFCFSMSVVGDPAARRRADDLLLEALALYRSLGDDRGTANVLWGIGIQHYFANDNAEAAAALEEALELYRRVGDWTQEGWALHQLGSARLKLGDVDTARTLLRAGLRLFDEAGDVAGVTLVLDDLAAVAAADGDLVRAARLGGLADRIGASAGAGLAGAVDDDFERATRPNAADGLAPAELERLRAEGATLTLADGVRYALGEDGVA